MSPQPSNHCPTILRIILFLLVDRKDVMRRSSRLPLGCLDEDLQLSVCGAEGDEAYGQPCKVLLIETGGLEKSRGRLRMQSFLVLKQIYDTTVVFQILDTSLVGVDWLLVVLVENPEFKETRIVLAV